jgi:CRISPR-associated exonuclease Cas4
MDLVHPSDRLFCPACPIGGLNRSRSTRLLNREDHPLNTEASLQSPPYPEIDFIGISALQHWLYCPRQCALIHLEQLWAENRFTAEGQVLHRRAHEGPSETRPGIRITRSLPVRSPTLGLSGLCDVVEFHQNGSIVPVEYKRGKPKLHRADEVQLCAQALCLEEMLSTELSHGYLFYGQRKRRTEVPFDAPLRALVIRLARELHQLFSDRHTPPAVYESHKCDACSLIHLCQPHAFDRKRGAAAWFEKQLQLPPGNSDLE